MSTTSIESTDDPFCDSTKPVVVTFDDVKKAYQSIQETVVRTPLVRSRLDRIIDMEIYLKLEIMQQTGSFKERGARYALMSLSNEAKKKGAIAASLGNHSQGMCYHGMKMGIPITVVMPVVASVLKIEKCKNYQGNIVLHGNNMGEAKQHARKLGKQTGMTFINGYDHPHIIAGQGTIGIEILEELCDVDAIIVPCGGGGLISGIATAVKAISPKTEIIGVESENVPGFSAALKKGRPTLVPAKPSIADGLAVPKVGYNAVSTAIKHGVKRIITVSEDVICVALLNLLENEKITAEGAGASPLAAILSGQLKDLAGKRVVLIISGGNIDMNTLTRVVDRGMTMLGRHVKFHVHIQDKPGSLSELCSHIAQIGATVRHIHTDPAWINDDFTCKIFIVCECSNIDEALKLHKLINETYKNVEFDNFPNACIARFLTSQRRTC